MAEGAGQEGPLSADPPWLKDWLLEGAIAAPALGLEGRAGADSPEGRRVGFEGARGRNGGARQADTCLRHEDLQVGVSVHIVGRGGWPRAGH